MRVSCPRCGVAYRIDPAKVPAGGVRARCGTCAQVFPVAPERAAEPGRGTEPPAPSLTQEPLGSEATVPTPVSEAPPAALPTPGAADPHARARRLARALVSDITVYHAERHERSLAAGTLRQEFRDEIRRSWDDYVDQVGAALARETPYFREALNEILARGRAVF